MNRSGLFFIGFFALSVSLVFGQYAEDAVRPWWGLPSPAARSSDTGIFYSAILSGDYLSVFQNPAAIALAERASLFFSMNNIDMVTRTYFYNSENQKNLVRSQYDGLGIVFPFKPYRGRLAIAGGYSPLIHLDDSYQFNGFNDTLKLVQRNNFLQEGVINSINFAIATEFRKNLFTGISFHLLNGYADVTNRYNEEDSTDFYTFSSYSENFEVRYDYKGIMILLGALYVPLRQFSFGINLQLPVDLTIHERSIFSRQELFDNGVETEDKNDYRLSYHSRLPIHLNAAVSFSLSPLTISSRISLLNWNRLEFHSKLIDPQDSTHFVDARINDEIRAQFVDSYSFITAAELELFPRIASVQFGYKLEPYFREDAEGEKHFFDIYSLGTRITLDKQITFNLSYIYHSGKKSMSNHFLNYQFDAESSIRQFNLSVTFYF